MRLLSRVGKADTNRRAGNKSKPRASEKPLQVNNDIVVIFFQSERQFNEI